MIDISVKDVKKSFDLEKNVLDGLSFQVEAGEHIGILGSNGAGKTTLFRLLTGEAEPSEGEISVARGRKLGLISQIPVYPPEYTVEDVLQTAFSPLRAIERELAETSEKMADGDTDALRRYDALQAKYETLGGYDSGTRLEKVCNGLSVTEEQRKQLFLSLSGGEKTRVNLGRLLLEDTDILLLDEPTNHLDLHATEWLEDYVNHFRGTVLTISHDRYFLDRTVTRIIALRDGRAEFYNGNYSFYAVEKERRYLEQLRRYEKEQAKIAQLEKAAEQLRVWAYSGMDKTFRRAASMEKRIERMRTTEKPAQERKLSVQFAERDFFGDEVLSLRDVSMSYGERRLFSDVTLRVGGGERIALLGDNGTGKTTLFRLIVGEEAPICGRIKTGPSVRTAYLPQTVEFSHPERSLVDTMLYEKKDMSAGSARNRLAAYDFCGEDVFKSVSVLSGGERSRLKLCTLMDEKVNFLILDEPTNHLDIASREWIEEAVEAYDGALLFVSHDRYFINRFATRVWELADGAVRDYPMGFAAYRAAKEREKALHTEAKPNEKTKEKEKKSAGKKNPSAKRLLHLCERDVAKAEAHLRELDEQMEENACCAEKLAELFAEKQAAEAELNALLEKWETLAGEAGE